MGADEAGFVGGEGGGGFSVGVDAVGVGCGEVVEAIQYNGQEEEERGGGEGRHCWLEGCG